MATPADHIAQAEHNAALFQHLETGSPAYLDWQVTCLFYAALHYVDAYLVQVTPGGARPTGHASRGRQVRLLLPPLYADYLELQDRSEDARYDLRQFTFAEVHALHSGQFTRIRSHIRAALGLPQ